jgi:chromosome segregation ATPase
MSEGSLQEGLPAEVQAEMQAEEQERFVEELAGAEDHWLTISQAARATGQSDTTIRHWISRGLLPVRRRTAESSGQVRLVRASDLAILAPIAEPGLEQREPLTAQESILRHRQSAALRSRPAHEIQEPTSNDADLLRRLIREQYTRQQEALERLRSRLEARFTQQQEAAAQHRIAVDEALTQLQTSFEDEIAALQIQTSTRQGEIEQQMEEITARLQSATQQWQQAIELQRQQIEALTAHLQQEVEAHEHLTREVLNLTTQLTEQRIKDEQVAHSIGQLSQQVAFLTAQLAEQRQRAEHEQERLAQHGRQLGRLEHELAEQQRAREEAQQEILGVLAGQQEQLSALMIRLNEQAQRYEFLSQLYVTIEQQQGEHEERLLRLYRFIEQFSSP